MANENPPSRVSGSGSASSGPHGKSMTLWLRQLKAGEAEAAQRLWETYFSRLVMVARKKLGGVKRISADEEDVALSAIKSLCLGAREGRFPQLVDPQGLWPLLVAITAHKSVDLIRGENRKKRGGTGGNVAASTDSSTGSSTDSSTDSSNRPAKASDPPPVPLSQIISRQPTPEFAAQIADQLRYLLERLRRTGDTMLPGIALAKMEGESAAEIAVRLGCSRKTVERKLLLIARLWEEEPNP